VPVIAALASHPATISDTLFCSSSAPHHSATKHSWALLLQYLISTVPKTAAQTIKGKKKIKELAGLC